MKKQDVSLNILKIKVLQVIFLQPPQRREEQWSSGRSLAMQSEGSGFESDASHCLFVCEEGKGKPLHSSHSLMAKANWICLRIMDVRH